MLNNNQVMELFQKEAILLGTNDAVPLYRVAELFGKRAAGFAVRGNSLRSPGYNAFGVGDYTLPYLTYEGFKAAASFANVEEIRDSVGRSADYNFVEEAQCALIPEHIRKDLQTLRQKYPGDSDWVIISEVISKAAEKANNSRRRKIHHEGTENGTS